MKWGWWGGWRTKMRERWFSKRLASTLCFSIWLSAPQLTCSLMLLMAGTLLQVQLPGPMMQHWAPPSLPATGIWVATSQSQKNHTWKHSSVSPPPGPFPLCFLPSAVILAPLCLLTSPAGNGSCLATIILFSWWSALISSPQLVSHPEAKRLQKGKHNAESLLGLLACLTSAFVMWLDVSKIILKRLAVLWQLFPIQQPVQHKAFAYWLQSQLKVLQCLMGVSDGNGAPGWEAYLTGLHLKWGSDTITNNSKAGKKTTDRPDPRRSCPFPTITNYSWQLAMLSRVSPPPLHYLQGQNQVRKTYKPGISDFSSLSLPTWRARNSKRKSTPPPEVFSTSRLFHTGSPQLWVHLAATVYSALPHWCWGMLVTWHSQVPWYVK